MMKRVRCRLTLAFLSTLSFPGAVQIFESTFAQHGMSPRQFSRLLKQCRYKTAFEGDLLVKEGKVVNELVYIVHGSGDITIGDRRIGSLEGHSFATSLSCLLPHTKPQQRTQQPVSQSSDGASDSKLLDAGQLVRHSLPNAQGREWLPLLLKPQIGMSAVDIDLNKESQRALDSPPTTHQLNAEGVASPRRSKKKRPSTHKTAGDLYRSTASTRLTSPEGRLLIIPLSAIRELLEADPGLEKPLLSLAAAETALRLALTQRRVQRLQRYKQRLHTATSGVYRVPEARKDELQEYADRHGIPPDEHEDALRSVGWTPQEWQEGYSSTAFRAITAKQLQHATGFVSGALQAAASLFTAPATSTAEDDDDDDDEEEEDEEDESGGAEQVTSSVRKTQHANTADNLAVQVQHGVPGTSQQDPHGESELRDVRSVSQPATNTSESRH